MISLMLLLVALADVTPSQHLPEKDDEAFTFDIPSDVLFHDTKVLPDAKEVTVYLMKNDTKRFFFVVEKSKKPIYFALTPCSSTLQWKIFFRYQKFQTENKNTDDPLTQQRDLLRRPKRSKRLLQSITSNEMMSYVSREFRSGLFILEVTSRDKHSTAKFYATSSPDVEMAYPEVASSRVEVVQKNNEGITIAWKVSPSEVKWGQPVEYCVAHNTRKSFRSMCALENDKTTDFEPPPLPQHAGFGFQWEKKTSKMKSDKRKSNLKPKSNNSDMVLTCVGRRTWVTLANLLPGTAYFVDVYAINPATNRSSAYKSMNFVTDGAGQAVTLPERQVIHVSLRHRRGAAATFQYSPGVKCPQVTIALLPCFGQLTVQVHRGSHLVATTNVSHLTRFRLLNVSEEEFVRVHVTGDGKQTQSLKIMATRRPKKDPFPEMRDEVSISPQSVTCNSVKLRWAAPDEKSVYCLYKRRDAKKLFSKQNWCGTDDIPKRNEKHTCRRYRKNSKQRTRGYVNEVVTGLRAGTRYAFEVEVSRQKGETLSYEPVYVTTKDKC